MSRGSGWNLDCKVYIGNLNESASKSDLESTLGRFGRLKYVWVARSPPGFAFVEFEDPRDAKDAVRALDGTRISGARVKVRMSHGNSRRHSNGGSFRRDRGPGPERGDRSPIRKRSPRSRSRSPPARYRSDSSPIRHHNRSPKYRAHTPSRSRSPSPN